MRLKGSSLACIRGGREVFAGLDFSVNGGEALLITGRNGAGKSTLLRVIARLLAVKRPIWLLDEPTAALDREAQDALAALMGEHLAGGGIIAAATHGPIGLDGARELRLGATP